MRQLQNGSRKRYGTLVVQAVAGRPPYPAARRDASPHHAAVTVDDLQRALVEVKLTVRKLVREARAAGKRMSILRACRKAWQAVNGGYPSPEALYDYCHSHKTEF